MLYSLIEQHKDGSWWYHPNDTFNTPEEVEACFKETFWWDLERPHKVFEHEEPMYQEHPTCSFDLEKFGFGGIVYYPKKYYGTLITNNKTMAKTINKEDYSITICFDKNGELYWNMSCKGQSKRATKEELLMVSGTLGLIKKRIDLELIKDTYKK